MVLIPCSSGFSLVVFRYNNNAVLFEIFSFIAETVS
jgi:hypothetical protein